MIGVLGMTFVRISNVSTRILACVFVLFALGSENVAAQSDPFSGGWSLNAEASQLAFQSVKNETKVETSGFATFSGGIDATGATEIKILLDSVDTKIDLRNVRMRFLFFETFQYPEAIISAQIEPATLSDLPTIRRKTIDLTYSLSLHGVSKVYTAPVVVTLLTDDLVSVATSTPISVPASDFDLMGGVQKLEDAAGVNIIPSATVSFDFMFARNVTQAAPKVATTKTEAPASAALEAVGNFDLAACKGRFEILSRTGNIYFRPGSSRLDAKSTPLLNSLADIVSRCPGMVIEVGGHTDSDGSVSANQRLSEARAGSVTQFLLNKGITKDFIRSVGYGEAKPVASNATREGKLKNRRIEFAVVSD